MGRASARRLDGNESEATIHRVMVRVARRAGRRGVGQRRAELAAAIAVSWLAAEASQERDIGGRKLASLSLDECLDASIPYNEDGLRAPAFGCRRARQRRRHAGRERPSGAALGEADRPKSGGSRSDSSCCLRGPAAQSAAAASARAARKMRPANDMRRTWRRHRAQPERLPASNGWVLKASRAIGPSTSACLFGLTTGVWRGRTR
jgi:hypothetical protein